MIAVLDYGIGNLASAQKALRHVGADAVLVTSVEEARGANAVVLPGVGAFGACMDALRASGLDRAVYEAVESDVPLLGICVGLQLLYESSEESPDVAGLGVFPGVIRRMSAATLPQMQWNRLVVRSSSPLFEGLGEEPWCYFVHSYAAEMSDDVIATCDYDGDVAAVVKRGHVWATQFHPEKSSKTGLKLLANFVEMVS